jgi:hypothetical protein
MPLHATDLIELAEAGQSAVACACAQAKSAMGLCAQARAGQLALSALLDGLDELFLGHEVVFGPFEQQFERTLLHYSALRLRVNANTARRMKATRAKRRGTKPEVSDYRHQLTLFAEEAEASALAAERAVSDDEAIFGGKTKSHET